MRTPLVRLVAAAAVLGAGCGGSSPTKPTEPPAATITSVSIGGDTSTLAEGASRQLTAIANYSDGSTSTVTSQATWSTSDATVATVSGTGLVTAVRTGNVDVTAAFSGQSGRRTLQVSPAQFQLTLVVQSATALNTCDDVTQGLTNGEFALRVQAVTPGGGTTTVVQSSGYPGDPGGPRGYNLSANESASLDVTRTFTLQGASGQSLRVQFNATEWDEQIVVIPPSIRWIHDSRLSDASTSRTHSYANGTFGSLGPNTLTLGNSSCGLRLSYTVSATRQ
jgi:hypothetical protein